MTPDDLAAKWRDEDFVDGPNVAKCLDFLADCVSTLGGGFHPDTRFEDYVSGDKQLFSGSDAESLDEVMEEVCHEVDAYGVALDLLHSWAPRSQ